MEHPTQQSASHLAFASDTPYAMPPTLDAAAACLLVEATLASSSTGPPLPSSPLEPPPLPYPQHDTQALSLGQQQEEQARKLDRLRLWKNKQLHMEHDHKVQGTTEEGVKAEGLSEVRGSSKQQRHRSSKPSHRDSGSKHPRPDSADKDRSADKHRSADKDRMHSKQHREREHKSHESRPSSGPESKSRPLSDPERKAKQQRPSSDGHRSSFKPSIVSSESRGSSKPDAHDSSSGGGSSKDAAKLAAGDTSKLTSSKSKSKGLSSGDQIKKRVFEKVRVVLKPMHPEQLNKEQFYAVGQAATRQLVKEILDGGVTIDALEVSDTYAREAVKEALLELGFSAVLGSKAE